MLMEFRKLYNNNPILKKTQIAISFPDFLNIKINMNFQDYVSIYCHRASVNLDFTCTPILNINLNFEIQKILKFFENVQTLSNASKCIQMVPNGSEWVRTPRTTFENFEKPRENFNLLKIFRQRPNASKMRPNASQWVRMDLNGSERVRKHRTNCNNFEKPRENC